MPLPEGWDKKKDFYPTHRHVDYRWGMVIDIDRCIGCEACVVACYMENNVGIVGKQNMLLGRQMSWIHVERYYEPDQPYVRFIPLLCQHCDSAPCESVCPMFAPQHSQEGINNQVYNRCIGTRDCNINCPWKVRRFNWFTWSHDYPLGWQLNPDVTVRQKGVMEKCSFCIQRIVKAKTDATSQSRKIKDGEFTTACAETCPTDAIVFGNLMDPESRVSKLLDQGRAYQTLGQLNTKPAVIYLKKITQEV
jgi:Fe-S-cluster-containing dehydrogenase component